MRHARAARGAAIGLATLAIALELANIWVTARLPPAPYTPLPFAPEDVAGTAFPVFGAILVHRRPRLVIGWLLCAGGVSAAANILSANLIALYGDPGWAWIVVESTWQACQLSLGVLLPLLYPAGRLPSRRWRWAVVPAVTGHLLDWAALLTVDRELREASHVLVTAGMALAFTSLAVRFARGDAIERRQILWLLVTLPGLLVPWMLGGAAWWTASFGIPLIPAAIAVAVLRYRLFGIDTLISRAVVGTGLALVVTSVYLAVGAASSLFLAEVHSIAGLAAALFAGAFFHPMRQALQRGVDRLLYGGTGVPAELAERLKHRLQRVDPGHGLLATLEVLREGLSVTGVAVELDGATVATGSPEPVARRIPLVWHGEPVGLLLVGGTARRRFPAAHDERVLATLSPYIADAAHAVRMTAAVQRSRQRILAAREEERRRLRRDLHDGLGQSLTGMAMLINAARLSLRRSPEQADRLLSDLRTGMDAISADIRQLVYGLRPPAIDELGLTGAIEELAGTPEGPATAVETVGDLTGLPAAVEVAAYRIVQEALTNARKHAAASAVTVRLERGDRMLRVTVTDDGIGLPPDVRAGVGLGSMRERAAELGGTCTVRAREGGGTVVGADLPAQ
ncbi:histidine kinase [Nonomuraea sp. MCN248]|uniref:Oxygen sensor histidine kinase NreB n=1 Tax=Nonomuraea corallina TaxID=2989783 RepID=A0ABT4S770_9ACTN|nr:sensor histidine kinase [Nonomuraea corallina]MDA0633043.1 histidine kinase [Nonomuraea corallina]